MKDTHLIRANKIFAALDLQLGRLYFSTSLHTLMNSAPHNFNKFHIEGTPSLNLASSHRLILHNLLLSCFDKLLFSTAGYKFDFSLSVTPLFKWRDQHGQVVTCDLRHFAKGYTIIPRRNSSSSYTNLIRPICWVMRASSRMAVC